MPYENVYRNPQGHLRLPFADLPMLLHVHEVHISPQERPALENMFQFLSSVMILAGRLRSHLSRYEEDTWVNVPFDALFLDTQAVVLFLRQFMEDVAFVVRAVLPPGVRRQMPAGFTDLAARIRAAGPGRDEPLATVLPQTDPFRQFLVIEEPWLQQVKDMRDDICHRTAYGRLRTATFPSLLDLIRAGGSTAPFASEADLRAYLCGLLQRWLALACLASEFVRRRIHEDHPVPQLPVADGFIVREGEIDFTVSSAEPQFPPGTTVMTVSAASLEGLEYFLASL
jgi:hypothetical protein